MPRSAALLLGLIFVGVLIKLDPRKKSAVSLELWVPTIWVLIIGSRMVSEWFSAADSAASADNYADGSPLDRNIFLLLIVLSLVIVVNRRINFQRLLANNGWVVAYLAYCMVSIVWSDFPLVSFKRYIKEIGNLMMALIVLSERDPVEAFRTLLKRCAYILIPFSIVLFKYFSELGRSYSRWTGDLSIIGVTNNKNSLGVICAVCTLGLFSSLLAMWRNKTLFVNRASTLAQVVGLALTVWVLFLARSATSIGCCMVGLFLLVVTGIKSIRKNIKAYTLVTIVIVGIIYLSGSLVSMTAGSLGRDETLTGRTEIWGKVIEMTRNPLIGGGYSSFWLGDRMEKLWVEYAWHPTEAHDGYLEIYLDLGLIGVMLIAGIIISAFTKIVRVLQHDLEQGGLWLAMLVFAILYNITESAFRPGLVMYFMFVVIVVSLPRSVRAVSQQPRVSRNATTPISNDARVEPVSTLPPSPTFGHMGRLNRPSPARMDWSRSFPLRSATTVE